MFIISYYNAPIICGVFMHVLIRLFPSLFMLYGCGGSSTGNKNDVSASQNCSIPDALAAIERRPLLVVRVNYNDITFRNDAESWARRIFGDAPHELNHYYETISYGRFGFAQADETDGASDGLVTVSLDKDHPDSGQSTSVQADLAAALKAADPFVDFSGYDTDGDGSISSGELIIIFILAGNEDAFSGENALPGVWAHTSCLQANPVPRLDGTYLMGCSGGGNYSVFGERDVDTSIGYDRDATIGVIAHELGHAAFDLPDLYDTSGASAGIGYFGLMGSGLWGQASLNDPYGNTPVHMTAWSKMQNGWIIPEIVADTAHSDLLLYDSASQDYNAALLPIGEGQCFMLENRGSDGYDAGLNILPGYYRGGMAIWHIDQRVIDANVGTNTVNADVLHKGVDLEEASNSVLDDGPEYAGDVRNLYYRPNATAFTPQSTPSTQRYDGSDSNVSITEISEPGTVMQAVAVNPNTGGV